RKRWPESNGIPGRNQLEWVAGMKWNHRPESPGISGRIALEYSDSITNRLLPERSKPTRHYPFDILQNNRLSAGPTGFSQ
ncbi:hypothetical protein, partial [Desulfogranum marinum]|uniref:hypothetical protein n=1 Tax=Desulfogranum marinum TaxID=453220 RepID=UPI001965B4C8